MQHRLFIVKADDFARSANVANWRHFFAVCESRQIVPSVGVIAAGLDWQDPGWTAYVRALAAAGGVEIWNHSTSHRDLRALSEAAFRADVMGAQAAIERHFGVLPSTFGYPYNLANEGCDASLDVLAVFRTVFFTASDRPETVVVPAESLLKAELGTQARHPFRLQRFHELLGRVTSHVVTLQVHPHYWCDRSFRDFGATLDEAKAAGFVPLTVSEYHAYVRDADEPAGMVSRGRAARADERAYARIEASFEATDVSAPVRHYMLRRIGAGAGAIWDVLRRIGFDTPTRSVDGTHIDLGVDIGCGTGHWMWPYLLQHISRRMIGVDRDPVMLRCAQAALDGIPAAAGRYTLQEGDAGRLDLPDGAADHIICNNVFNFLDQEQMLMEAARVLGDSRAMFLGVQRRNFLAYDIQTMAGNAQWEAAEGRLTQLVAYAARRHGIHLAGGFSHYESDEEIYRCFGYVGLRVILRDFDHDPVGPGFGGESVCGGYLALKTQAATHTALARVLRGDVTRRELDELWHSGFLRTLVGCVIAAPALIARPAVLWRCLFALHRVADLARFRGRLSAAAAGARLTEHFLEVDEAIGAMFADDLEPARLLLAADWAQTDDALVEAVRFLNLACAPDPEAASPATEPGTDLLSATLIPALRAALWRQDAAGVTALLHPFAARSAEPPHEL